MNGVRVASVWRSCRIAGGRCFTWCGCLLIIPSTGRMFARTSRLLIRRWRMPGSAVWWPNIGMRISGKKGGLRPRIRYRVEELACVVESRFVVFGAVTVGQDCFCAQLFVGLWGEFLPGAVFAFAPVATGFAADRFEELRWVFGVPLPLICPTLADIVFRPQLVAFSHESLEAAVVVFCLAPERVDFSTAQLQQDDSSECSVRVSEDFAECVVCFHTRTARAVSHDTRAVNGTLSCRCQCSERSVWREKRNEQRMKTNGTRSVIRRKTGTERRRIALRSSAIDCRRTGARQNTETL